MKNAARIALYVLIGAVPGLLVTLNGIGSVNRLIGILCFVLWIAAVAVNQRFRQLTGFHFAVLGFTVWYIISLWWALVPADFDYRATMLQSLFMCVLVWDMLRTRNHVNWAIQAYVMGGYVSTLFTLKAYLAGERVAEYENRFTALGFDPNDLALLLVLGIPMAAYLATELPKDQRFRRAISVGYPFIAVLGVMLTGSRGAFISAIPAFFFLLFSGKKLVKNSPGYVAAFVALATLALSRIDLSGSLARLGTVTGSHRDKLTGRGNLWHGGWVAYGDHPYFGFGAGSYAPAAFPFSNWGEKLFAHETYLSVLTELGPIGFLFFGWVLFCVIHGLYKLEGRERWMWAAVFGTWAIGVAALSWEFRSQTWLIFSMIVSAAAIQKPAAVVEVERIEAQEAMPLAA